MTLSDWLSLLLICLLGAVSPGPSILVVLNVTLNFGRVAGIWVSFGHGIGIFLYAFLAAVGLTTLALSIPNILVIIQTLGGLFLLWICYKVFCRPCEEFTDQYNGTPATKFQNLSSGFLIVFLNPKIAVFFFSIFSIYVTTEQPFSVQLLIAIFAGAIDMLVYLTYVYLATVKTSQRFIKKFFTRINTIVGFFFLSFALYIFAQVFKQLRSLESDITYIF